MRARHVSPRLLSGGGCNELIWTCVSFGGTPCLSPPPHARLERERCNQVTGGVWKGVGRGFEAVIRLFCRVADILIRDVLLGLGCFVNGLGMRCCFAGTKATSPGSGVRITDEIKTNLIKHKRRLNSKL